HAGPAVGDRHDAGGGGGEVLGGGQVVDGRGGRLDEQEVAAGAGGRDHVQIEGDLDGPVAADRRQRARGAGLALLGEAAVRGGAGGQAEGGAVDGQVGLGGRVVVRVDDRDGLSGAAPGGHRGAQAVGVLQLRRAVAGRGDRVRVNAGG